MTGQPSGSHVTGGADARPLVSVCINNYNYARFLGSAIDSVLDQDYPFVELVVVDDGSTDDSDVVLRRYAGRGRFISKENGGHVSAVNAGFAASTGSIVIFLDSDDELERGAVSRVVRDWTVELSKIQYRLAVVDRDGKTIGAFPHRDTALPEGDVVPELLRVGAYPTPTTSGNAYSRSVLEQIMPIPESFAFGPDGYLNACAPFYGPVHSVDDVLGIYRQHGANDYHGRALDLRLVRRRLSHEFDRERALRATATARGYVVPDDLLLRLPEHVLYLLLSIRLDPGGHPVRTDRRSALLAAGVQTVVNSAQLGPAKKCIWVGVLTVVAYAPRRVALRAADWLVAPRPRPPWARSLARGIDRLSGRRLPRPETSGNDVRVLLLFSDLSLGGAERNVVSLLPFLPSVGVKPTLCTLHAPEGTALDQEVEELGIDRVDLGGTRMLDLPAIRRLVRRLRSGDVDVLHTEDKYSHILGGLAARLARVPVVMTRHVMREGTSTLSDSLKARLDARALRSADRVIAVSDAARTSAMDSIGVAPSKVVTVYNGLGGQTTRDRLSAAEIRSALGWPHAARIVTMIAALRDGKGHEVLLESVARVRDAIPSLLVVLVGSGPRESELRQLAAPLGEHVRFLGERRDVATILAGSDVVVLPSWTEALPTVLLEAASAALPVVATNVGGTPEIVVEGVTGRLVPPGDPDALARELIALLRDPEAGHAMGRRAKERVESRFSIERQAAETAAVYRAVLEESTRGNR
jgi:glycosyltransferase involved in cell wall biosynthesis